MGEPLQRVAVLTHLFTAATAAALAELAAAADRLGLELLMPADEVRKHPTATGLGYRTVDEAELRHADLCLVLGGDGTILRSLSRLLGTRVPTLGVNYGNVGFLASLPREGWMAGLETILGGDYREVELLTVDVLIGGEHHSAVNDVILSRVAPRHVLQLEYEVAGVTVGEMFCDGLIIASPTGSTAYNLSCNGPIVEWNAGVLVLNFIAPHSLGFRPVILRPDHVITARNVSPRQECEVMADGDLVGRLCCGDEVRVTAGSEVARLVMQREGSFYQNVEEKLFDRHDAR
ncbi:MAG TPA: NAD(+)/NADH kinase [Thermoleophilia bacterium]|nr:NAD(+)/NADH kinase [Thermoleophilia bacterium]